MNFRIIIVISVMISSNYLTDSAVHIPNSSSLLEIHESLYGFTLARIDDASRDDFCSCHYA